MIGPRCQRRWLACTAAVAALALLPAAARAENALADQVSQVDRALGARGTADIDDIIARANALAAVAARCQSLECPELQSCADVRRLEEDLSSLISLLQAQQRYLEMANKDVLNHFRNLVNNETLTGAQRAALIEAIALQEALIRFSDSMAAAATIISSVKSVVKSVSDGNVVTAGNALDVLKVGLSLKTLQDSLLSSQSVASAPGSGFSAGDARGIAGSLGGALGQIAEAQSELAKAAAAAETVIRAGGFDVVAKSPTASQTAKAALIGFTNSAKRVDSLLVPVGEIVQTLLSSYAKQQLGERQERLNQLISQAGSEGAVRAEFAKVLRQVQARRFATMDALAALEAARGDLYGCMAKAKCPPGSRVDAARLLPDFSFDVPGVGKRESWGKALTHILGEVEKLRPRITTFTVINNCPPTDDAVNVLPDRLSFAFDSTTFCTFGDGNPIELPVIILPPAGPATTPPEAPGSPPPASAPPGDEADPVDEPEPAPSGGPASAPPPTAPPAGGGKAPEPEPCEDRKRQLDALIASIEERLRLFDRVARTGAPVNEEARASAQAELNEARRARQDLEVNDPCPKTPEGAPGPSEEADPVEDSAPPPNLPLNITVKATQAAIESGGQARDVGGQVIKLFAPSQLAQALPSANAPKPQDDHDADPIQGVTDAKGEANIRTTAGDLGGVKLNGYGRFGLDYRDSPTTTGAKTEVNTRLRFNFDVSKELDSGVTLGGRIRMQYDAAEQDSVNVIASDPQFLVGLSYKQGLYGNLLSLDKIGDYSVGTLTYDKRLAPRYETQLRLDFPQLLIEPNLCRIKEPAAVTEYHACKLGDRTPPPGARVLLPPPPHADLPGATLSLAAADHQPPAGDESP